MAEVSPPRAARPTSETRSSRISTITSLSRRLKSEWEVPHPNVKRCTDLLEDLKLKMTKFMFLMPTAGQRASRQELALAREVLEIGVQVALAAKDIPAFERYVSQLKCYYFDYQSKMADSPQKYHVLGLNLLYLLSQYRLADFHTELELLTLDDIQNSPYIKHPVSLEQYLMEGCYNKIFYAKNKVPSRHYHVFMDVLLETVRGEIATCLEKAYGKISLKDATRKLYFAEDEDTKIFGVEIRGWKLDKDGFFRFPRERKPKDAMTTKAMAANVLSYAKELEMIV